MRRALPPGTLPEDGTLGDEEPGRSARSGGPYL
jgi:hypothetical protein